MVRRVISEKARVFAAFANRRVSYGEKIGRVLFRANLSELYEGKGGENKGRH